MFLMNFVTNEDTVKAILSSILYLFPLYRTLKNNNKNYYITNKRKKDNE